MDNTEKLSIVIVVAVDVCRFSARFFSFFPSGLFRRQVDQHLNQHQYSYSKHLSPTRESRLSRYRSAFLELMVDSCCLKEHIHYKNS